MVETKLPGGSATRRSGYVAAVVVVAAAMGGALPSRALAQINVLAPTFSNLNGAAAWGSLGFNTGGAHGDGRPQGRWGFAAFYGPFGGRGDTLVTFTQTFSDSGDTTGSTRARPGPRATTTRQLRGDTRRLGGGKVTLAIGYQHSSFCRFGAPPLSEALPVGGAFVASLLGPYPLPLAPARLSWYGGVGGTIVKLSDIVVRADTLAVTFDTERTFAPEAMVMLMYNVAPSYRMFVGASYQYIRFGSVSYQAAQSGDRISGTTLATLPDHLELRTVHVSLGFSFTANGLIPRR